MKIVYCLHDTKTNTFSLFGLFKTKLEAKRNLTVSILRSPDIVPSLYPDDFSLCGVGMFNDEEGAILPINSFEVIDNCGTVAQILAEMTPKKKESTSAEVKESDKNA